MAHYVYRITQDSGIPYCDKHLPKFLESRKKAGLLETTESWKTVVDENIPNIVYTPDVTEETPVDATPKKRSPKKKAE
jgi:hypothetical protein